MGYMEMIGGEVVIHHIKIKMHVLLIIVNLHHPQWHIEVIGSARKAKLLTLQETARPRLQYSRLGVVLCDALGMQGRHIY